MVCMGGGSGWLAVSSIFASSAYTPTLHHLSPQGLSREAVSILFKFLPRAYRCERWVRCG